MTEKMQELLRIIYEGKSDSEGKAKVVRGNFLPRTSLGAYF